MNVGASGSITSKVLTGGGASSPAKKTTASDRFKALLRSKLEKQPGFEWSQVRKLARAMFGDAAFTQQPGQKLPRLDLGHAQLRTLADHPKKIEAKLQELHQQGVITGKLPNGWAAKAASLYSDSARAVLDGASFTVATVNDDFATRKTNLRHVNADVVLAQETKNVDVRNVRGDAFGVHQNRKSKDIAGTAIVWKRAEAKAGDRGYAIGVRPNGAKMMTRYINYTDLTIDGQKVRMISVHRPPLRFKRLWPLFDKNLAKFIKSHQGPVIVGMDANERNPQELAKATGLSWHAPKGSIDGFLVSKGVTVGKMWRLPKGSSDHNPVVAQFHVKPPHAK